ncbi:MAG: hypothetical protein GX369_03810 [Euryarchaeota archaeon]|nr:hypothetical protein [Euryarchaeota archaeon]
MKIVIVFDTVHGSTGEVAAAIAEEARSSNDDVEMIDLRTQTTLNLTGDMMFIGSPTRSNRMTRRMDEFIKYFVTGPWRGRHIVAFDTVGPLPKNPEKRKARLNKIGNTKRSAAGTIQEALKLRGLSPVPDQMHLAVTGLWGPLASDARDMARELARIHIEDARKVLKRDILIA